LTTPTRRSSSGSPRHPGSNRPRIPLGLGVSLFTSRLATSVILDVRPADPLVRVGVTVLLTVASFAAVLVPASRAARVEPLEALRAE
jgi:putative ABC transport system permease protein